MSKIIFLGTDLHGEPTELAAKTVKNIKSKVKNHKILSIEHRKKYEKSDRVLIVPKIFNNSRLRRSFQAMVLPLYLTILRLQGFRTISSFWVANRNYHKALFRFLRLIGFKIIFTIISGENTNFGVLKHCDKIVCQSPRMMHNSEKALSNIQRVLIYPGVDLETFNSSKKKSNQIVLASVPYKIEDFSQRGIEEILGEIVKLKLKAIAIFRSDESYEYVKNKNLPKVKLINRSLENIELANLMSKTRIIPLFYSESPDMPLSAIEGLASGCAIICTEKMGLGEVIEKEKAGIVIREKEEIIPAIKKILKNSFYNKNARKVAEKYFDVDKSVRKYIELFPKNQ